MRKLLLAVCVGLITVTSSVHAFNLSFMQYSSVYYFTKSDWALSESTALRALNTARDNQQVSWKNSQTGAHGYFMPFHTTVENGMRCRKMKIVSEAHKVPGESVYHFCKINGDWKIT